MNNPAQGVAQQLQPHVHLISLHRFPLIASLNVEQAFRYLLDAPSIVKQIAPMSWNYVSAPQDGTLWLEWIPLEKTDQPFPSDGYAWGDPEQTYRQDFSGYTIEWRSHQIGYRPGHDQVASHARTRYHFISKNPSVNAPPPDPSLWIVHYHAADPNRVMPASNVPVSGQMRQTIAFRTWLESQGRLERRDFMLHDREHWPSLNIPGQMQQPGQYNAMQNRYPQQHYPQQGGGPPAAKKARTSGPSISMPGSSDGPHDSTIEMDEDTALGDFFDHLTQRDISLARYMQHHRWMEEVFSSPYASSQIVPPDLGMGLMGELKGLTDGILEPPNMDFMDRADSKPPKAKEATPFTNLKKEQVEEFGKRVQKHLEEGHAEIERMKAEHAAKMQDWKKVKSLMQAEKRLRFATWEGHEDAVPTYRLEEPLTNGHGEEVAGKESVDDVVKEVEDLLKVKITGREDAKRVARGGLRDRKPPPFDYEQQNQPDLTLDGLINDDPEQSGTPAAGANGSSTQPTFHDDPMAVTQTAGEQKVPSAVPQSTFQSDLNQGTPNAGSEQNTGGDALDDLPGIDMNDTLMDGMDIDVGDSNLDFGDGNADGLDSLGDSMTPAQPEAPATDGQSAQPANTTSAAQTADGTNPSDDASQAQNQGQPGQTQPSNTETGAGTGDNGLGDDAGDTSMFNDTFDDLTNIDGNGDDGLIDFDGGGMGMDDSAFGDALHGMDAPDGSGDGNTPATGGS
ncbi:hypothetical protein PRZ48_010965 [Zasmidium cellare]|uniref:DUF1750-domain-containing protein n=1 Tax=Zasmidium cellare TaxID=395010 RepID=A0ABR0EA52_ZASCE|nr:hypothetical protein PRZ48_010965 [Zasmidium cellare]